MKKSDPLTASLEDYLEAIFEIISDQEAVRPKDIAGRLNVRQSSVTGALRVLAKRKLIRYTPYGVITLTHEGQDIARGVSLRHSVLRSFMTDVLLVNANEANEVACKMEHVISDHVFERMVSFAAYIMKHRHNCHSWNFSKRRVSQKPANKAKGRKE